MKPKGVKQLKASLKPEGANQQSVACIDNIM